MPHNPQHKNVSGYTIQTAVALVLFILGLMLLVIWAILYANRLSNNLSPEWWIWFFLGFGVALMIVGLIWLIIVQYMVGSAAHEMYEELCAHRETAEFLEHEGSTARTGTTAAHRRSTTKASGGSFARNE